MKRYSLLLGVLFVFTAAQAQYKDFGTDLSFQKGDFAAGDIDNDGDLDIIFSGDDGDHENGAILINDGTGQFTKQEGERIIKIGLGGNIQFGDIDGDGDLDVIFAGWGNNGAKGIALNDGHGVYTLAPEDKYPINKANKVTSCGFADFNMDGLLDYYFFGNYKKEGDNIINNNIIYYQQPDGSFAPSTTAFPTLQLNEAQVSVMDFDNDGCPDIFVNAGNEGVPNTENQRFSYLFKNDGFGNFEGAFAGVELTFMKSNGTSSWGDFNGDGYLDLLHNGDGYLNSGENNDRMWRIYKNKAGNAVEEVYSGELGRQNSVGNGSLIVDWDNDGKLDFIAGGWNETEKRQVTDLYLGDNPSNFTFTRSGLVNDLFPGISEQSFCLGDLDGDNKVDLLIAGYSGGTLELKRRIAGWVKNTSSKASTLPNAPTDLNAVVEKDDNGTAITFTWKAPASENGKYGTSYNLALKNKTTGKWLYNPMAVTEGEKNGWRKVGGRIGNVYLNKEFYLYDLPAGEYEWTVQAINGAYLGGKFAEPKTFTIQATGINAVNTNGEAEVNVLDKTLIVKDQSAGEKTLKVYSVSGALLKSVNFANEATATLQDAGIYIIELQRANGTPYRTKISIK